MSAQHNVIASPAVGVPVIGADLDQRRLATLDQRAAPALTTAPASPQDGNAVVLDSPPGKRPLVRLSEQPPNYESPIDYLGAAITPNEDFFVRYNLSDVPRIDADRWTLAIGGPGVKCDAALSLADLRKLPAAEVAAVCQCSGNGRSLFEPPTPGTQWGRGAIGCAH